MVMRKLVLGLALSLSAAPAFAGSFDFGHNAIIGGTEVQSGDPVAASTVLIVGKEGESTFICTGSIIDRDIILTAAHCLGTMGNARVVVAFRTSIQGQGPVIAGADTRRMEDFLDRAGRQDNDWHDVALIKLAQPIPANYQVAKMLPSAGILRTGGTITMAGYGINVPLSNPNSTDNDGAGTLRKVEQKILNETYGETEFLVDLTGGRGACHGDSGGPALVRDGANVYVAGIASRMTERDRVANNGDANDFSCSVEMVYTNTLKVADWIAKNVRSLHGQQ